MRARSLRAPDARADEAITSSAPTASIAGDLLFWTGFFAAGLPSMLDGRTMPGGGWRVAFRLAASGIGLASEYGIMLSRTAHAEASQLARFSGDSRAFLAAYRARTGVLLPRLR